MQFVRICLPIDVNVGRAWDIRPIRSLRPIEYECIRDILARTAYSSRDKCWPGTIASSASKGDSVGGVRGCIIEPCIDRADDTKVWPTLGVCGLYHARRYFVCHQGPAWIVDYDSTVNSQSSTDGSVRERPDIDSVGAYRYIIEFPVGRNDGLEKGVECDCTYKSAVMSAEF